MILNILPQISADTISPHPHKYQKSRENHVRPRSCGVEICLIPVCRGGGVSWKHFSVRNDLPSLGTMHTAHCAQSVGLFPTLVGINPPHNLNHWPSPQFSSHNISEWIVFNPWTVSKPSTRTIISLPIRSVSRTATRVSSHNTTGTVED